MIKDVKRIGIFAMYDVDGIADDYVIYLLDAIKPFISNIIVVCQRAIKQESIARLKNYASDVIINDKGGYDCGSYKVAINKYDWDVINEYDELILFNDSNYGPIYPLSEMFEKMDNRECDFWTLTYQEESGTENVTPAHYRSDFFVFKKTIISNSEFRAYWKNLQFPINSQEAVKKYELALSKLLHTLNFKGMSYIERNDIETHKNAYCPPITVYSDYVFIISSKIPFVKKKGFMTRTSRIDTRAMTKILKYIKNITSYNENLILKHLIRICDVSDIKDSLGLSFILSQKYCYNADILKCKKIGIILHLVYTDLLEYCFEYINKIPDSIDVIVTTTENNKSKIKSLFENIGRKNYQIIIPQNRGREISAVLIACKELISQYDYLCCVHDKKSNHPHDSYALGQTFMDLLWDNSVVSAEYIKNVINCFEENPLLGLLAVPPAYHGKYFVTRWSTDFNNTKNLSERLKLKCKISEDKQPLSAGNVFWCRTVALKTLFDYPWRYDDFLEEPLPISGTIFNAIELIYPYVAQHEGYMTGTMMSDEYAGAFTSDYQTMLQVIINNMLKKMEKKFSSYNELINSSIYSFAFADFLIRNKNIYLYGAGYHSVYFLDLLLSIGIKPIGFVLSTGHRKETSINGFKVYELNELPEDKKYGLLVTVAGKDNIDEIIGNLNKLDFTNFFCFYNHIN